MEYTKGECGCRIAHLGIDKLEIEYCPLHKAAPDLYEACKEMIAVLTLYGSEKPEPEFSRMKQAIAKVEGG